MLEYSDYRDFLKVWFWNEKGRDEKFSFRHVSKLLQLSAPNHFHLVISKKRQLSEETFERLMPHLSLSKKDEAILWLLFQATVSPGESTGERSHAALESLRHSSDKPRSSMNPQSLAWYMRSAAPMFNGLTSDQMIERAIQISPFPLTADEVCDAIDVLCQSRVLNFETGVGQFDLNFTIRGLGKAHHQMNLDLAQAASQREGATQYFNSVTVPASSSLRETVIKEIRSISLNILEAAHQELKNGVAADQILTLHFSLFPFFEETTASANSSRTQRREDESSV